MGDFADQIKHIVSQGLPLTQRAQRDAGIDIRDAATWPPGSMMAYWSDEHFGLGLVVANRHDSIAVVWAHGCKKPFCVYKVDTLNSIVIRKVL